jgi:Mlc titration factor MtfA (ptsG expression regulator)
MKQLVTMLLLIMLSVFTVSLQAQNNFSLIGKKGIISYPNMKAYVIYSSDSTLHWKTVDEKGVLNEGNEVIRYKRLNDNLHFLNWIEKDGFTVSQVIDTRNGTVKSFLSFNDDKSARGGRSAMFVDGKFIFDTK